MNDEKIYQELSELVFESVVEKINNGSSSIILINELNKIPSFETLSKQLSVSTVHNQHIENHVSQILINLLKQKIPNINIKCRSRWGKNLIIEIGD